MAGATLGSDQVAQGFIPLGVEYLQGQRLCNLLTVWQFSLTLNLKCQWWRGQPCCHDNRDTPKQVSLALIMGRE